MTKREKKLNNLWNYLIKITDKETLKKYNMRAFLYGVGRISYEQCLIELVSLYYGKIIDEDKEVEAVIEIIEKK